MKRRARAAGITAALAAIGVVIERFVVAAPHYTGPVSDHFDGRRFHNQQGGWQTEGSFIKWQLERKRGVWREWVDGPAGPPPEKRVADGRLRVTLINHATMLLQMDGMNILTDPIWSDRCSPVSFAGPKRHRPPGIRFEDLPPIDAVIVSHNHYDHLDVPTLRRIRAEHRAPIHTMLGNGALLRRYDIDGVTELDWWQKSAAGVGGATLSITAVPAQHFSARGLSDRDANLWGGFVLSGPSGNIYFAGDTGWGKHFEEIGRRFAPLRLAALPIGAYEPRWFMKPAHITPAEAVDAHLALGAGTSVPMHYGTFELSDEGEIAPLRDLQQALEQKGRPSFRILEHGQAVEIP